MTERLDVALAGRGLARSRSQAAELIAAGRVRVDGAVLGKAGARVAGSARIEVEAPDHYVSRAAHKLVAGLDRFGVAPADRLALDLGASTGGFTQVLLERGARQVIALDVGHGQLAEPLRKDSRVVAIEGCNARGLTADALAELSGRAEAPTLLVGDLSFISLTLVMPAIARVAAERAELLLLVKPQFEVGRQGLRGGIVADPALADDAVRRVIRCAEDLGFAHGGTEPSPITGEHGNREFLTYFWQGGAE
ncbi:TlyA family RNA methyltransferase [Leucobacter weissii]|uniref:TlyA family RNA methyltransferase n=1 Tax=Leucobacter weissii TaxID=1983706 RepID=A0A939MM45_9MICO|nr:TlyA family RNA methyltransferase [Leucobacter weissii]